MSDLKKHGWKFALIALLFGIVGSMEYEHETQHEVVAKAYYDDMKQQYGRTYVANEINPSNRTTRIGEHYEHSHYGSGGIRNR